MRSSEDVEESDTSDIEWRKYLKTEADDDEAADDSGAGAAARAPVIRRDRAATSDVATEERRSTDATENGEERPRTVSGPLSRDSSSGAVWTTSRTETERQSDRDACRLVIMFFVIIRHKGVCLNNYCL